MEEGLPWDESVDKRNTARMKEIVAAYGWPTLSDVGAEAADDAWLLVQHADRDTKFQARCLELIKNLPESEVSPINVAYLEDRVRVNTGKPQLYGTQFDGASDTGESFGPRPIEDVEHLDERRASVGLKPFAEYSREMNELDRKLQKAHARDKP